MFPVRPFVAACAAMSLLAPAHGQAAPAPMQYPPTRRDAVVETRFGEHVADPYRWLEADVRVDPQVAEWVAAQSVFTDAYLKGLPERPAFERRLNGLFDYARFGLPREEGGRLFHTYNSGLMNQAQLMVRDGPQDDPRVLLDPNTWASDGATALDDWAPSPDGALVAYTVQDGGSDWRTMRFVQVADGTPLGDELRWVKFTRIAWVGAQGVLYSRFEAPAEGEAFQARTYNHTVWYHRIGTPQAEDRLVFATPEKPAWDNAAAVTSDARWLVVTSHEGTDPLSAVAVAPIGRGDWQTRALIPDLSAQWDLIDGIGDVLWFVSNKDAPLKKVVRVDLSGDEPVFTTVVPESDANLEGAAIVGDRLVLHYLRDVKAQVKLYTLDGQLQGELALPGVGAIAGISGKPGRSAGYFGFTSFTTPGTVHAFDALSGKSRVWEQVPLNFAPEDYAVEQVFYPSKDGTRIPMFIVRRKDVKGPVPTILYGYGGFNIALPPAFSPARMAWLEAGGAYAIANLRGGGEYGDAWHHAGRRAAKQNVFDDCIAAGEWLIAHGVTSVGGLAVEGGSNGGLLVGAVINQRPDLFAAAHPAVGVMDMLRFDQFTAGRYWVDDYGYPDVEADWRVLRAYSPYHNIRDGVDYPAVLVTTADTDDRVVPGHSFKYAAALQAAPLGARPRLIRIETRAGHGAGKPVSKQIEETADVYAFLAHWTGLKPRD
ncbi:Prolyl oligopeptidase [Novosphingobium lubricantis]